MCFYDLVLSQKAGMLFKNRPKITLNTKSHQIGHENVSKNVSTFSTFRSFSFVSDSTKIVLVSEEELVAKIRHSVQRAMRVVGKDRKVMQKNEKEKNGKNLEIGKKKKF